MANEKETIHFILTGGTMDSFYDGTKDTAVPCETSVIPKYIKSMKLHENTEFTEVSMKDSRNLDENDIKKILKAVQESPHKKNHNYTWNL